MIASLHAAAAVVALFVPCQSKSAPTVVVGKSAAVQPKADPAKTKTDPKKGAAPTKDGAAKADAAKSEAPKESPRMQKLKAATYDRRPSAILKVWSGREEKKDDKPAANAAADAKKKEPEKPDPIEVEVKLFQRRITLGEWPAAKAYLAGIPADESKAAYSQLLQSLSGMPPGAQMAGPMMQYAEKNTFNVEDVIGLASLAPKELDNDHVATLGRILNAALTGGAVIDLALDRLDAESKKPAKVGVFNRRQAALLVMAAGEEKRAGRFLPSLEEAQKSNDLEALNLLARVYLAITDEDARTANLEKAWAATQAVLAANGGSKEEKETALVRAVELAPKLRDRFGVDWLDASFTSNPQRGMDILATIGGLTSNGMTSNAFATETRLKTLQLQKSAVEALLKASAKRADEWRPTLGLLARGWLREAEHSRTYDNSSSYGPRMRRDVYGNLFFMNEFDNGGGMPMMGGQRPPQAISVGELLRTYPADAWLTRLDAGLQTRFQLIAAQLHLKVNEDEKAFPFIEKIAARHPEQGKELVAEFLRVWNRNHDPNAQRNYTNPYYYMYGFERRAEGIPLTRSKQERNLVELAKWVERLKKLKVGDVDEKLLVQCFTTCHSSAEVYRLDAIQKVFGPLETITPKTLAGLAQQMRRNLAGLWRTPAEQEKAKTNRKQRDIQGEVTRGYAVALKVVDDARAKFPKDWSLRLARASLLHDETAWRQELQKSADFTSRRREALAEFAAAAQLYAAGVRDLKEADLTTEAYELWFYAGLGAVDPGNIDEEKQPDPRQPALIKAAIDGLPGDLAEKHRERFANLLFTRMSGVKPAAKFNYVKGGFDIVGDHKAAWEARKVYDYYKDLVSEIKLDANLDGSPVVGTGKPFGVFVNLRHTRDIERESGGFSRYLQNQNGNYYYYNYGRPNADYRDRFQKAATEALREHFEVVSCTFQSEKVNSRAMPEFGWRYTPYCYLLLKPRGPRVDRIPPLRLDLDFLDTSGYVVLPVESPPVPIDAAAAKAEPRPVKEVKITQTLDERQASSGKLLLEVKATAHGLVGDLDDLVDLAPPGFVRKKVEDQGVAVAKFSEEADGNVIQSERLWTVSFEAPEGVKAPSTFVFGKPKPGVETLRQRYQDADLMPAEEVADLERGYGQQSRSWIWQTALAAVAAIIAIGFGVRLLRRPVADGPSNPLPEKLDPFSLTAWLESQRRSPEASDARRREIASAISDIERRYFQEDAPANGAAHEDLRRIGERFAATGRG